MSTKQTKLYCFRGALALARIITHYIPRRRIPVSPSATSQGAYQLGASGGNPRIPVTEAAKCSKPDVIGQSEKASAWHHLYFRDKYLGGLKAGTRIMP